MNAAVTDNKRPYPKLDRTIEDAQQRNRLVHEIVNTIPHEKLTPYYLEQLAKYIVETPKNKKEKTILTDNRMVTVNKREVSYQGLVQKLQNGEDGIYNFMANGDTNILLVPKIQITQEDIETIPGLLQLRQQIKKVQIQQRAATGKRKFLLTKQLIEMRQQQYILKNAFKQPVTITKATKSLNQIRLDQEMVIGQDGQPRSNCLVSLFDPHHVCCLLCNYSKLKEDCYGHFDSDWWYLMEDLDTLLESALKEEYPVLYDIMKYKIDGLQNKEIAEIIKRDYDVSYSVEYLSTVWRKKIPKIVAQKAKEEWLVWHYTFEEKGKWKRCSCCHEIKLAHSYFFTKNKTAKDGFYSICKQCRNKKNKKGGNV